MPQAEGESVESGGNDGSSITRACDMCRKKKIRCQPTGNSCQRCIKYKTLCHFTPISRRKGPRRSPGQKRVEELENRLKTVENRLKHAYKAKPPPSKLFQNADPEILHETTLPASHASNAIVAWNGLSENRKPQSPFAASTYYSSNLRQSMYDLLRGVKNSGIGMTSPAILFNGNYTKEWNSSPNCQLTRVNDVFSRRIIKPLPQKSDALYLINKSFQGFSPFPLFNQTKFIQRFESDESPYEDPGWWACLNVVLALAHRIRSMVCLNSQQEDREAWGYFQNALAVMTELTMLNNTLTAVQALLGMAIIVQGTPNPAPYSNLTTSAMKLAQSLNLHRSQEDSGLPRDAIEERKRVFWIAYFLDKDVALRIRHPPTQDDDEMDVELPLDDPTSPEPGSNYLMKKIGLAQIQGQIYKRLLSVSASRQSYPQRIAAVTELEAKLQAWKSSIPIDFRREDFEPETSFPESFTHTVILRLSYFNTLAAIHSSIPSIVNANSARSTHQLEHRSIIPPPITFVDEARKAIKLLHLSPQGEYACIWIVLHIFVSATKTLLEHLLKEPGDPLAREDFQLIDPMLRLLGMLAKSEQNEDVTQMYNDCLDLFERANEAVGSYESRVGAWVVGVEDEVGGVGFVDVQGIRQEKESVEDFIRRIESISAGYDDLPVSPASLLPHTPYDSIPLVFGSTVLPSIETGAEF